MKVYKIVDTSEGDLALVDEGNAIVQRSDNARRLSDYGFSNGADQIRHDYDLIAYEERQRR